MAGADEKVWKKVIKHIGEMDEDDNLEAEEDVENMMIDLKINPDFSDEMQDMLYDQLTQYNKKELLADVQMDGPEQSLEPLRKAMAYGKKKMAENVHRARNRVTRPEIAETMGQLEERYRSWRKDIAYLKDIGAYVFKDQTMVDLHGLCAWGSSQRDLHEARNGGEEGQQFEDHTAHDGEDRGRRTEQRVGRTGKGQVKSQL